MYYTVYRITNLINNKTYIGKHQTNNLNDNYIGSGKILLQAIKKYGKDNFTKEILFVFDNEIDMNNKEAELVIISEQTYNLCPGGKGGFGYINNNNIKKFHGKTHSVQTKEKIALKSSGNKNLQGKIPWNKGKKNIYTEEHKRKISEKMKLYHASKAGVV